ncbi:MAG: hypothetical protein MMC33_007982 [Icmadophila ericetorum]|nr:hypothetical protein [Icmadophila ericetorum]
MSKQMSSPIEELDGAEKSSLSIESSPSVENKKLLRKVDLRVLPMLFIVYFAAFLDRVNISNALTLGLPKDLGLVGYQSNIALTIFFVPYVLFEIPSNILMKRFKPHKWQWIVSGCILAFGVIMLAQGFVQSYGGLLATRFCLGLAEAGIFPGSLYLISFWYKREEAQRRFSVFWCSVLTANMSGSLLASAIANINGVRGYSSWRWIFILEGIFTILVGIVAYFLLADFPEDVKWLTEEERNWVIVRTGREKDFVQHIEMGDILHFFAQPKNILGGLMYFAIIVPTYGFAYFGPTIVKTLGYSTVQTQLHTVPPFAAALALALILAFLSDRTRVRIPYIIFCSALTIAGLITLINVHHSFPVQYAAIHLVALGSFSAGPIVICWFVMNLHGHAERSIGTAWMISFGNTGGFISTFAFLASDAPRYIKGYTICLTLAVVGFLASCLYGLLIWRGNKKLRSTSEQGKAVYYSL